MNQTQRNNGDYLPWVMKQIQAIRQATDTDEIAYDLYELVAYPDAPPVSVQRAIIFRLENEGAIHILDKKEEPARDGRIVIEISGFRIKILHPQFEEIISGKQASSSVKTVVIKKARLDEYDFLLEINDGAMVVRFKAKPKGVGRGKMNKIFKTIALLWESRTELRNGKVVRKGDFVSAENLKRISGCISNGAVKKQVDRLNGKFEKHGLPIIIDSINGKFQLRINLA